MTKSRSRQQAPHRRINSKAAEDELAGIGKPPFYEVEPRNVLKPSMQKLAGANLSLADVLDTLLAAFDTEKYLLEYRIQHDAIEISCVKRFSSEAKRLASALREVREEVYRERAAARLHAEPGGQDEGHPS